MIKTGLKAVLHVFWVFPVEPNKITLLNDLSYTYGDSMKYLDLYLHERCPGKYEIVFPLKEGAEAPANGDRTVTRGSLAYYKELLTSQAIVTNCGGLSYLPKRKGQLFLSTWHGGGPYKKTSTDVYQNYWYRKEVQFNHKNMDYILSSCRYFSEQEARSMGYSAEQCVPAGLPRNDILFAGHRDIAQKVRDHYGIPEGKKFILYAPTFRSGGNRSTSKVISRCIDLDVDMLLSALKERFQSDWVCGIRLHPRLADMDMSGLNVINCTTYPDMQELLCCADAVITDYSSLMWDFSFTYRPVFLYAPDIEQYEKERGFYMPVSQWPYPLAHDNGEMRANILAFDEEDYVRRVKEHHLASGSYETGEACRLTVDLIDPRR